MERFTKRGWFDIAWVTLFGLLSSIWGVTAARELGATYDEPFYLSAGLQSWRTGSFKALVDKGTMPLPAYFALAPVYAWEKWRGEAFDPECDINQILPVARATTLLFWWILLGYGWYIGQAIAGAWGGRLAVALLAAEPTLLGHAALATTDIALTACLIAFLVHFRAGRLSGWSWRVGTPAVLFAIATLAKVSGLVFGILGMVLIEIEQCLRQSPAPLGVIPRMRSLAAALFARPFRRDAFQVVMIGLVLVFVFCGSDWKPSPSLVAWAKQLPEGPAGDSMRWVAEHTRVFSNAGNGLGYQIRRNIKGQEAYLLGDCAKRAFWYFFPVALSVKLTLTLLLLPVLLALLAPGALRNWAIGFAALLLIYSLNCRVQLGVRLVLPLVAMAAIGLGAALAQALAELPDGWRRRVLASVTVTGLAWMVWSTASVWPHGLCYANELWGGTPQCYLKLSGSDFDWGQGVKELHAWQRAHGEGPLDVVYYGTDPAVRQAPLHLLEIGAWPSATPADVRARSQGTHLAVGTSMIYSPLGVNPKFRELADWLKATPPAARTTMFLIYDLRQAQPPAAAAQSPRVASSG